MFMFQTLKLLPAKFGVIDGEVLGVLGFGIGGLLLLLVPFMERRTSKTIAAAFTAAGIIALIYIVVLTVAGYLA
jgi:quinol-cytochrome oxidoreductase complex cytochrome b subunit